MPILLIGVAVAAAVVAYDSSLFVPAVIVAVLSFWGNGVLANYGRHEAQSAPNWAAAVSMLTTLASVGILIAALAT